MFFGKKWSSGSLPLREALCRLSRSFSIEALCTAETAASAREALERSGKLWQRESPLQPLFMLWFVVCLPIFRSDAIPALLNRLVESLRGRIRGLPLRPVTDGAIAHARARLGVRPLRLFFRAIAGRCASAPSFHGRRVKILDGVRLLVPDTPGNAKVFGRHKTGRGRSAFPQILIVVLLDALTRGPLDAKISSHKGSERAGADRLLRSVSKGDLLLLDRGFFGLSLFRSIHRKGADFLARAPSHVRLDPIEGAKARRTGDYLAIMRCRVPLTPEEIRTRPRGTWGKTHVVEIVVRVIAYRARGFPPVRLVTSLLERSITAAEIIALYHQRWEIETAFDELKTTQLAPARGTLETELRSRSPRGVLQEAYALLASYALVRQAIAEAAGLRGITPTEIGFADALRVISLAIPRLCGSRAEDLLPLRQQMLDDIADCRLDRSRRPRRYPRVVKRKVGRFPLKREHHRALPPMRPLAPWQKEIARR